MNVYKKIQESIRLSKKQIAVLIDPDKWANATEFADIVACYDSIGVDYIFVGGSTMDPHHFESCMNALPQKRSIPLLLFPGAHYQIHPKADALLFLSLVSGRNPEYLIGQQVKAAPAIQAMQLETIATAYILINGGIQSSTMQVTQTQALDRNDTQGCISTALAAKMMGMQAIYLEAGSGARIPIPTEIIRNVKHETQLPLIVGGGIKSTAAAKEAFDAGADIIVIGNALEKNPNLIKEILHVIRR